ncbi:hypothetical protein CsatB_001612 [Cannabis sativa]
MRLSISLSNKFRIVAAVENATNIGKCSFVEHRTFLHLYRSFHRLWIFLALMFQTLAIIAFNDGRLDMDTFKSVLSIGPTFSIMNFIESFLDIILMFGSYTSAIGMAISRQVIRFFWFGLCTTFVTYVYLKVLDERNSHNSNNSFYFRLYILVLGVYAGLHLVLGLLLNFPACHSLSAMSDQSFFQRLVLGLLLKFPVSHSLPAMPDQSFFKFFKRIYQVCYRAHGTIAVSAF